MDLKIKLKDSTLKATGVSGAQADLIIEGYFKSLGGSVEAKKPTVQAHHAPKAFKEAVKPVKEKLEAVEQNPAKVVPKIGEERSLNVPIGEAVASKLEQDHWHTGIKVEEDGTKRYRAYYWCDCGSKGKRYVLETSSHLTCRDCGTSLLIEGATMEKQENGLPVRDNWGNFYIARENNDIF